MEEKRNARLFLVDHETETSIRSALSLTDVNETAPLDILVDGDHLFSLYFVRTHNGKGISIDVVRQRDFECKSIMFVDGKKTNFQNVPGTLTVFGQKE